MPSRSRRLAAAGGIALLALAGAADTASARAAVPTCAVVTTPLAGKLRALPGRPQVTSRSRRDADSLEPVEDNAIVYADGTRFTLEQRNCAIYNLRLTLAAEPDEAAIRRFAAILAATPVWQAHFAKVDPTAFLRGELAGAEFRKRRGAGGAFSYATDALPVTGETSETLVSFDPGKRELTLTIAAGN